MNLNKIKKIYIVGIEGAGTSALAGMFKALGKEVSGSDEGDHFYYEVLKKHKIKVFHQFNKNNLPKDAELVIYSIAFNPESNPEIAEALKNKIKTVNYGEALGLLFNQKYGIAICGSHGKSTITAWLSFVMEKAGLSPSMIVGAKVSQFNGNSVTGNSDYLVIEADEYGNKLRYCNPQAVLLNNIDYDHPDYFKTKEDYQKVFIEFIKKIPTEGFLVVNFDDPFVKKIANTNCHSKVISYAIDGLADYTAYNIKQQTGSNLFKVRISDYNKLRADSSQSSMKRPRWGGKANNNKNIVSQDKELGDFQIQLSGKYNIYNALAVIATGVELGIKLTDIKKYLAEFKGVSRRMEVLGKFNGAIIIDDYAHHPTEIQASLAGARRQYKNNKIITVFHPHTFTRTKAFLNEFAKSFNNTDEVIVLDIYGSAREKQGGVHSRDLVERINKLQNNIKTDSARYISTLDECEEYLRKNIKCGDVVILMGAGDVIKVGKKMIKSS